jgi:non-ribosomal peptide synthetase component F
MGDRVSLVNMYGITETTVHVTAQRLTADLAESQPRSIVGRPLNDLRIRIVAHTPSAVSARGHGEILVSVTASARAT